MIRHVGDTREIRLNVRILAATNRDLDADVAAGSFRADLFRPEPVPAERLNVQEGIQYVRVERDSRES